MEIFQNLEKYLVIESTKISIFLYFKDLRKVLKINPEIIWD